MKIRFRDQLSFRQARNAVVAGFLIGLLVSALQIVSDLIKERKQFDSTISQVIRIVEDSAGQAAYDIDRIRARKVINGLFEYQPICDARLIDDFGSVLAHRSRPLKRGRLDWAVTMIFGREKNYAEPLFSRKSSQPVGQIRVQVDTYAIAVNFIDRAALIIIGGIVRNLILACVFTVMFYYSLTRPLLKTVRRFSLVDPASPAEGQVSAPRGHEKDEMGLLIRTVNHLLDELDKSLKRRQAAEREIAEREAFIRGIMENVPDGILTINQRGLVESYNPAADRLFGDCVYPLAPGFSIDWLIDEPECSRISAVIDRYLRSGNPGCLQEAPQEAAILCNEGPPVPLELRLSGMRLGDQRLVICVANDISDRKQAEEQIAIFRQFAEASGQGFGMADLEGRLTYVNPALCRMLGEEKPEDALGKHVTAYYTEEDVPRLENEIFPAVIGQGGQVTELPLLSADGHLTPVIQSIFTICDDAGNPLCLANVITDIAERKRAEEELARHRDHLEELNRELQRLDRLKDEFLTNTSHELRTPLNGIIGIADSMLDGAAGPLTGAQEYNLSLIVSSGRRLMNLINDVLDFSRLKHKELQLRIRPLDMRSVADVVLMLSRTLVGNKDLQLLNEIPPDLPAVDADENRVQQILHNLVGNAVKFTEAGRICVSARVRNGQLAVTVSDTGIGIPKEKAGSIFEAFEQANGSTGRKYGGTGLGLAVTRQLVELHGGRLRVASEPGKGSAFTFTLPVSEGKAEPVRLPGRVRKPAEKPAKVRRPAPADSETACDVSAKKLYRILIADDEPVNLQVLTNHLSLQNYAITTAANGREALAAALGGGRRFDLVILDVMMPGMSGYEVCRQLRKQYAANELPVVMLTARNRVEDLIAGFEAGANDYLTKPFSKEELLVRLETHLSLKELVAENVRLEAELAVARRLQQMVLPPAEEMARIEGLDIVGFMEPAAEVGGDYYDVLRHNGTVKIGIGDVTGHGLESGVLMLMTQTAVRTLLNSDENDPRRFLEILNHTLYKNIQRMQADKSLTLSLIDYEKGRMKLSGQHEQMIVVRRDGRVELVDTLDLGFPIGLADNIADFVREATVDLEPGDGAVLYSDGITEAENAEGELYGLDRLCEMARRHWAGTAEAVQQAVIGDVRRHIGKQKLYDDLTLVVIKQQ